MEWGFHDGFGGGWDGELQGRLILAHLCEEPKGLKTGMCTVRTCM